LQGPRPLPPAPLDPSDDAGIAEMARVFFVDVPAPITVKKVCAEQKSTFFHLFFSVAPKIPEKATNDWKERAEESVASYVRHNC
jgi:hypothetical protein